MKKIYEKNVCRACSSLKVLKFKYEHLVFPGKPTFWSNLYCQVCGVISHYKNDSVYVNYESGEYRADSYNHKSRPPIAPWSEISFLRSLNIVKILKKNKIKFQSILDYGGYQGYLAYALAAEFNVSATIADYDKDGLKIAKGLGLNVKNLGVDKIKNKNYSLILLVHVLEHIDRFETFINNLLKYGAKGAHLYIEVPNLYGAPMSDKAHLMTFSKESLSFLLVRNGFKIVESGYTSTPDEAFKYNYNYMSNWENLYFLVQINKEDINISLDALNDSKSLSYLLLKLDCMYFWIILSKMLPRQIKSIFYSLKMLLSYLLVIFLPFGVLKKIPTFLKTFLNFFLKKL